MSIDPRPPAPAGAREEGRSTSRDVTAPDTLAGVSENGPPAQESGQEPIRTLLWTAATERPLAEVVALVGLLKRTGEVPSPGDEALRAAAVARPVEEVTQLVAMLNEPPHACEEADTTLRAAAVGRPIEDVAQLVTILGGDGTAAGRPEETGRTAPGEAGLPGGEIREAATVRGAAAPPAVTKRRVPAAGTAGKTRADATRAPSLLRLPAIAVLVVCGLLHLPTDYTHLASGGPADVLALVLTVLCLASVVWLAVRDTLLAWVAGASAALAVVIGQAVSGIAGADLLSSSLGDRVPWGNVVAVVCAVAVAGLAGAALMLRQKAPVTARAEVRAPERDHADA